MNYRQLKNAKSERNILLLGRAHQLTTQYQMISPENKHASNIIKTELILFRNIYVYYVLVYVFICLCVCVYMHIHICM